MDNKIQTNIAEMSKREVKTSINQTKREISMLTAQLNEKLKTLNLLNARMQLGSVDLNEEVMMNLIRQDILDEKYDTAVTINEICHVGGGNSHKSMVGDSKKFKFNKSLSSIRFRAYYPLSEEEKLSIQNDLE